ncbi:MAG: hypothetical protein GXY61_01340 [Lentisphaerae bacterium]|nr:hypothetical protein [Lentisphaerota bacterium]
MKTISCIAILTAMLATANSCRKQDDTEAAQLASFASVALQKGEWQQAYDQLVRASALRPSVAEYQTGAGMAAVKLGRMDVAETHYDTAAQILAKQAMDDPERFCDYALLLGLLGRYEEAITVLKDRPERFLDAQMLQPLAKEPDMIEEMVSEYGIEEMLSEYGIKKTEQGLGPAN